MQIDHRKVYFLIRIQKKLVFLRKKLAFLSLFHIRQNRNPELLAEIQADAFIYIIKPINIVSGRQSILDLIPYLFQPFLINPYPVILHFYHKMPLFFSPID